MNLYLITKTAHVDYDEYDSMVVASKDKKAAEKMGIFRMRDAIKIRYMGRAVAGMESGEIILSFRA